MRVEIHHVCVECDAKDPKIISIFDRERYCGASCHAEGHLKHTRMILREKAEGAEHG